MVDTLPSLILLLTGLGFIGFGAAFTLWPSRMAAIIEIPLPTATAKTDFAATYGGFELGFGCFLVACTRSPDWLQPGLWAGAAALIGFAAVRAFGIAQSRGRVRNAIWIGWGMELAGVALNLWGLEQLS